MSHCAYYGENFEECKDYPTYCDNRCWMYQQISAKRLGDALKELIGRLEETKNASMD